MDNQQTSAAIIGVLGILLGIIGKYVMDKRKTSGRIDTTEAAVLWEAQENIRKELTQEVRERRQENNQLRSELNEANQTIQKQQNKIRLLNNRIFELEAEKNGN